MLEMLVVLAIVALIATLSAPFVRGVPDRLALEATTSRMVAALRSTRAAAIARNARLDFVLDLDHRMFVSPVTAESPVPRDIGVELKVADLEHTTRSRPIIRFYSDGSSTGGEIALTLRGLSSRICVNWLTGVANAEAQCGR